MPHFCKAIAPSIMEPLNSAFPFPKRTNAKWERGAKSPLAPTEPFSGMQG